MNIIIHKKSILRLNSDRILAFIYSIVPFSITIAIEGTFSIQSIYLALLLLLLYCVFFRRGHIHLDKSEKTSITLYIISIFVTTIINMTIYGEYLSSIYFVRILYYLAIFFFYIVMTDAVLDENQLDFVFKANVIAGIIIALYFVFINQIWYVNLLGMRVDKNFSSGILAIQGEMAVILFFKNRRNIKESLIYMALYIVIATGVFFSGSRASVLVLIGGTVLLILDEFWPQAKTKTGLFNLFIIIIVLFLTAICFLLLVNKGVSNESYQWYLNRYFLNSYNDRSNTARLTFWSEAIRLWLQRPIFGYGSGAVNSTGNVSATAHNTFLDLLVDQGVVGLIGFIIIIVRSLKGVIIGKNKKYRAVAISIMLFAIVLSSTRSVLLWYTLTILWQIGNQKIKYSN